MARFSSLILRSSKTRLNYFGLIILVVTCCLLVLFECADERLSSRIGVAIPVICRTYEERFLNPDRINLDRRQLTSCPHIEGEAHVKLINFQHNAIRKIERLGTMTHLIFLDFYDNQIEQISGLESLLSLRVLMLGRNRIRRIENLDSLEKLDVLDLHGNLIVSIENIEHLHDLRVLNLASNLIEVAEGLHGLKSLAELNLRRNNIKKVSGIECLHNLRRLFLSYNGISSFEDVSSVTECSSLREVCMDNNPLCSNKSYRSYLVRHLNNLHELDLKRVTEDEVRRATLNHRREEERLKEYSIVSAALNNREKVIEKAQQKWENEMTRTRPRLHVSTRPQTCEIHAVHVCSVPNTDAQHQRTSESVLLGKEDHALDITGSLNKAENSQISSGTENKNYNSTKCNNSSSARRLRYLAAEGDSLCEVEGDTLHLYGGASLEALDETWSLQAAGQVNAVAFDLINFNVIASALNRVHVRFPNIKTLIFYNTNISSLNQLNSLSVLKRLDNIIIQPEGNPIVQEGSLWKSYILFRLAHLHIKKINGKEITDVEVQQAERLFTGLSSILSEGVTPTRRKSLLITAKKQHLIMADRQDKSESTSQAEGSAGMTKQTLGTAEDPVTMKSLHVEQMSVESTTRALLLFYNEFNQEGFRRRSKLAEDYISALISDSTRAVDKKTKLESYWRSILTELVRKSVTEMLNLNDFMSKSLSCIK